MRLRAAQPTAASLARGHATPAFPVYRGDDSHSLILLGYANAMYRLGYRYETGLGNNRNPDEAVRCYFKSAKLGNAAALARLAPQCAAPPAPVPPAPAPAVPRG
jgi:TPR repeat protein